MRNAHYALLTAICLGLGLSPAHAQEESCWPTDTEQQAAHDSAIAGDMNALREYGTRMRACENAMHRLTMARLAEVTFQLGNMSETQLQYEQAAKYYLLAVKEFPENAEYQAALARMTVRSMDTSCTTVPNPGGDSLVFLERLRDCHIEGSKKPFDVPHFIAVYQEYGLLPSLDLIAAADTAWHDLQVRHLQVAANVASELSDYAAKDANIALTLQHLQQAVELDPTSAKHRMALEALQAPQ